MPLCTQADDEHKQLQMKIADETVTLITHSFSVGDVTFDGNMSSSWNYAAANLDR